MGGGSCCFEAVKWLAPGHCTAQPSWRLLCLLLNRGGGEHQQKQADNSRVMHAHTVGNSCFLQVAASAPSGEQRCIIPQESGDARVVADPAVSLSRIASLDCSIDLAWISLSNRATSVCKALAVSMGSSHVLLQLLAKLPSDSLVSRQKKREREASQRVF